MVVDIDLGENQVPGALESVTDHAETVKRSLELRNIKIKVKELPIPVAFAAAFEDAPVPQARAAVRAAAERVLGADVVADMLGE